MAPLKVATIVGTRPEAIKMALLAESLSATDGLEHVLVSTGQHANMVEGALSLFGVQPDINLDVMRPGQSLTSLSALLFEKVGMFFREFRPNLVIVHGDTTSALVAAMSAFYEEIPVAHVEAGLRSGSLSDPFPEEYNRKSIDQISEVCFAPTELNRANLLSELKPRSAIHVTGNTVVDAVTFIDHRLAKDELLRLGVERELAHVAPQFDYTRPFIFVTCHRRESFGPPLHRILGALTELSDSFPEHQFVFPVHPNPSVHETVWSTLGRLDNVHLTPPLAYQTAVFLVSKCSFVMTDSGGLQEEAPTFGKRVIVLRNVTERQEGVANGNLELVGTDEDKIISVVSSFIANGFDDQTKDGAKNPFGDGKSVSRITGIISGRFAS